MSFGKVLSLHNVKEAVVHPSSEANNDALGSYHTRDLVFLSQDGEKFVVRLFSNTPVEVKNL